MDVAPVISVIAIGVAAIAGLAGIVVGARLTARNDRARWLREQRLAQALAAVTDAAALTVGVSVHVRSTLQSEKPEAVVLARTQGLWDAWLVTYDRTRLVMPPECIPLFALHVAVEELYALSEATMVAGEEPDDAEWDEAVMAVNVASRDFLNFAQELIQRG